MGLFDTNTVCPIDSLRLTDLLPDYYFTPLGKSATGDNRGDTLKFVEIFEGVFCQIQNDIGNLGRIIDVDETDEQYVDMLIRNLGFDLNVQLSLDKKRKLTKVVIQAYKQKGTCIGIENVIRQFTGVDVTCFPFTAGWVLDVSELAVDTYLNPAPENAAGFYTFDVLVSVLLSQEQRRIILDLIELIKPAHSHFRQLVELGTDTFIVSVNVMTNRGSLYLYREQNDDGGWDSYETDGTTLNASSPEDVSYDGIAEYFCDAWRPLPRVNETFVDAVNKLVDDVTYSFVGQKPRDLDIMLLNRAALILLPGSVLKRDEAIEALEEFMKAIAFLNNYNATVPQISATTQPERDSTTTEKRARFLYLWLTNTFGLGEGIYRYVGYIRDFIDIGDDGFADQMTQVLYARVSPLDFVNDFGNRKIGANAAIAYALQRYNLGLIYESRIQDALSVLNPLYDVLEKLYIDPISSSGRLIENAFIVDLMMSRANFDRAKSVIDGLRLKQRIEGSLDCPIDVGTRKLRELGAVLDVVSRAIKRIEDEGL